MPFLTNTYLLTCQCRYKLPDHFQHFKEIQWRPMFQVHTSSWSLGLTKGERSCFCWRKSWSMNPSVNFQEVDMCMHTGHSATQSQPHRVVCVRRDIKDPLRHSSPTPLPGAGTSLTRSCWPRLQPTWPWTLPVTEHPQLLWATRASASPPCSWK